MVPLVLVVGLWRAPRVARGATVPLGGLAHLEMGRIRKMKMVMSLQ